MWILEGAGRALESAFFRGRFDESQIWALGQPLPCTFALLLYALSSACGSCLRHHTGAPRRCASLPSSPPPHSAHTLVGLGISDSRARCTGQVLPTWPQVRMPRAALEMPSAPRGTQTNESRAAGPGAQARAAFESPGGFQRAAWLRSAAQNPGPQEQRGHLGGGPEHRQHQGEQTPRSRAWLRGLACAHIAAPGAKAPPNVPGTWVPRRVV